MHFRLLLALHVLFSAVSSLIAEQPPPPPKTFDLAAIDAYIAGRSRQKA